MDDAPVFPRVSLPQIHPNAACRKSFAAGTARSVVTTRASRGRTVRRPTRPSVAQSASYSTPVRRLDEAAAAKRPVIRQAL